MNTLIKAILTLTFVVGFSFSAMADDSDITESGVGASIGGTDGPALNFTPSGNTRLAFNTTSTAYTIGAVSGKTDKTNGIEYAMVSSSSGYYQNTQTGPGEITTATDAGVAPDWTYMGGEAAAGEAAAENNG